MLKRSTLRFIICSLFVLVLAGCGSGDSETNGNLDLTVSEPTLIGGTRYKVVSTAVYSNSSASGLEGMPITIRTSVHTATGPAQVTEEELEADSSGAVESFIEVDQMNEVIFVDVTARTGGLVKTDSVSVPAL